MEIILNYNFPHNEWVLKFITEINQVINYTVPLLEINKYIFHYELDR